MISVCTLWQAQACNCSMAQRVTCTCLQTRMQSWGSGPSQWLERESARARQEMRHLLQTTSAPRQPSLQLAPPASSMKLHSTREETKERKNIGARGQFGFPGSRVLIPAGRVESAPVTHRYDGPRRLDNVGHTVALGRRRLAALVSSLLPRSKLDRLPRACSRHRKT